MGALARESPESPRARGLLDRVRARLHGRYCGRRTAKTYTSWILSVSRRQACRSGALSLGGRAQARTGGDGGDRCRGTGRRQTLRSGYFRATCFLNRRKSREIQGLGTVETHGLL